MSSQQLLRRAWDALDSFRQAYPENWSEDDDQVLKDLMRTDLQMSGARLKWVGLTFDEMPEEEFGNVEFLAGARWAARKLKERNT